METYNSVDKEDLIKRARIILTEYQETLDMLDQVFGCVVKSSWNFSEISSYTNYLNHDQAILIKIEKFDKSFKLIDGVSKAVNAMRQPFGEILLLKYRENYTVEHIAEELHLSKRSIYRYIQKAHVKFMMIYDMQRN